MTDHTITLIALLITAILVVNQFHLHMINRRLGRLERARAKPEDVTRMWDVVEWVEDVRRVERATHTEVMTITPDGIAALYRAVAYADRQQAEARLMAAIDAEPKAQPRDAHGRFVKA